MATSEMLVKQAQEHMEVGESVSALVFGVYETKMLGGDHIQNGVLFATDRRVLFYGKKMFGGYDLEFFPYATLSSIEMKKGFWGYNVTLFASGHKFSLQSIRQGDVPGFITSVKERIGKRGTQTNAASTIIPEQIKKLAELRDAGIITEDEFQTKKSELLARM